MPDLKFMLNAGIGDLIFSKYVLHKVDGNIYLSVSKSKSDGFRSSNHYDFICELLRLIYNDPKYHVTCDQNYCNHDWVALSYHLSITPEIVNLHHLSDGKSPIDGDYVVISTKVREYSTGLNEWIKILLPVITEHTKVVLLGERKVSPNNEYNRRNMIREIFSFYDAIPKSSDIIDMTYDKPEYDIGRFRRDCSILKGALVAINFGVGGNLAISASLCSQTINLIKPPAAWNRRYYEPLPKIFKLPHHLVYAPDDVIEQVRRILALPKITHESATNTAT
jgi:hypothetical protein